MNIQVELENPRAYSGGMLYGKAILEGDFLAARALTYKLGYKARLEEHEVCSGVLADKMPPGGSGAIPFELKIPEDAPVSYRGAKVSVDWFLEVSANLPWKSDPSARVPLTIVARPAGIPAAEVASDDSDIVLPKRGGIIATIGGVIVIAIALAIIPSLLMVGTFFLPFAAAVAFLHWLRFSQFRFVCTPVEDVALRAPVRYSLQFRTRRPMTINAVKVRLVGNEVWTTGSGKSRHTYRQPFLQREHTLAANERLPTGVFSREGCFEIPADQPTSVPSTIEYRVEAVIDLPWWPDKNVSEEIEVIPVIAEGAAVKSAQA